jgi:hypothetical protein
MHAVPRHRFELRPATAVLTCALALLAIPMHQPARAAALTIPTAQHVTIERTGSNQTTPLVARREKVTTSQAPIRQSPQATLDVARVQPHLMIGALLVLHHLLNVHVAVEVPAVCWINANVLAAFVPANREPVAALVSEPSHPAVAQDYALGHCLLAPPV